VPFPYKKEVRDRQQPTEGLPMNKTKLMLNAFFLPEDQDAFARAQGWADAEQMCYYENMASESPACDDVPPMTDREVEDLARVSSEEVYSDDGMTAWADMTGVY